MNLTHVDQAGKASMVDVGDKEITRRVARASGRVFMKPETLVLVQNNQMAKGDVLTVARIAGIQSAKRTSELIPLCHNLFLSSVKVDFELNKDHILVHSTARTDSKTGVEMEALTAVSCACLTIYDMCKAVDKGMIISQVQLEEKEGGKSGHYVRENS